jgi:hypothetical protein
MLGRLHRHLTYANVVATVALFVALGGSSYAAIKLGKNSVRSQNIAPRQVKRSDIGTGAVTSAKIEDYSLLPRDLKDNEAFRGPKGDKGDPGGTNLKVRATAGTDRVTANCAPGEVATGGGAHSVDGFVDASAPASHPDAIFVPDGISYQGYTPTSWTAHADAGDGSATPVDVTAWVVCAAP